MTIPSSPFSRLAFHTSLAWHLEPTPLNPPFTGPKHAPCSSAGSPQTLSQTQYMFTDSRGHCHLQPVKSCTASGGKTQEKRRGGGWPRMHRSQRGYWIKDRAGKSGAEGLGAWVLLEWNSTRRHRGHGLHLQIINYFSVVPLNSSICWQLLQSNRCIQMENPMTCNLHWSDQVSHPLLPAETRGPPPGGPSGSLDVHLNQAHPSKTRSDRYCLQWVQEFLEKREPVLQRAKTASDCLCEREPWWRAMTYWGLRAPRYDKLLSVLTSSFPSTPFLSLTSLKWKPLPSKAGEGNGNPLQYSCLENPVDRGAWWIAAHRVTQSRIWLKRLSMHALEKEMATHSSVLPWRIPGTEEPGGLPSMESQSRTRLKQLSSSSPPRPRHFRLNIHQLPAQSGESAPSFCNARPPQPLSPVCCSRGGQGRDRQHPHIERLHVTPLLWLGV